MKFDNAQFVQVPDGDADGSTALRSERRIDLPLNAKMFDMAKEMGLDISQTVDGLLTDEVMRQYWQRWNMDNARAIPDYNARIAREGAFSDHCRTFMCKHADGAST
jgi:antitoxin CcdA